MQDCTYALPCPLPHKPTLLIFPFSGGNSIDCSGQIPRVFFASSFSLTPQIQYIQHPTSFHHCIYLSPAPLISHLLIPPVSSWSPFPPLCFSWGVLYTQKSDHVTSQLRNGLHCTAPGSPYPYIFLFLLLPSLLQPLLSCYYSDTQARASSLSTLTWSFPLPGTLFP